MSTPATPHHLSDSQHRTVLKVSPTSRPAQGGDPLTTQTSLHHDSVVVVMLGRVQDRQSLAHKRNLGGGTRRSSVLEMLAP